MMSPVILYWHPQSPSARSVALVLSALHIKHEKKFVDLPAGDGRRPEYIKMNPQHNVPFLKDDDFGLAESTAIILYLAERYNNPALYPLNDLKTKSTINHRLVFNNAVVFDAFAKCFAPVAFKGAKSVCPAAHDRLIEVLGWVNDFLTPTGYIAGTPGATVADLAFLAYYTTLEATGDYVINLKQWPQIASWAEKMKKTAPDYETANGEGTEFFRKFWESKKPQ